MTLTSLPALGLGLLVAATALVVGFVVWLPWIVQPFLRVALRLRYRVVVLGRDHVPRTGPVLVVANHLSWFDGFFLAAALPRRGTALVNAGVFRLPIIGPLARRCGLLAIPYTGPKAQRAAIATARQALDDGQLLAIFPEGQLTRTGFTGVFHRGLEVILADRDGVPVVPVALDGLWGSLLSYSSGVCLRKRPESWRRRTVVVAFGPTQPAPVSTFEARQAVLAQGVVARAERIRRAGPVAPPTTIDSMLPDWREPILGLLAASTANIDSGGAKQIGQKLGTVGSALPGLALRAVGLDAVSLGPDTTGRLEVLRPEAPTSWVATERTGRIDRDGFVTLDPAVSKSSD